MHCSIWQMATNLQKTLMTCNKTCKPCTLPICGWWLVLIATTCPCNAACVPGMGLGSSCSARLTSTHATCITASFITSTHILHFLLPAHCHKSKALAAPREPVPVQADVDDAAVAAEHALQVLKKGRHATWTGRTWKRSRGRTTGEHQSGGRGWGKVVKEQHEASRGRCDGGKVS